MRSIVITRYCGEEYDVRGRCVFFRRGPLHVVAAPLALIAALTTLASLRPVCLTRSTC